MDTSNLNDMVVSEMPNIDLGAAIKQSIKLLKANAVLLIASTLLTLVLSSASCFVIRGPMMMGMFIVCDRLILGKGGKPDFGDVFKGMSFFFPGLILDIVGDAGVFACGVGAIVTVPISVWAMMRVADTGMGVGAALKDAVDFIFKKKQYMFVVVWFVADLLAALGVIVCWVGVFVTLPLMFLIPACVYRQVYKK